MRTRVIAIGTTTLIALGAVVGAVAASPGPAVELRAASAGAEKETEKYLGTWTELLPSNMPGDATGSLKLIGTEKDPASNSKPDLLTGKVDFGGAEYCPAEIDAAASKAVETLKERGKKFDPDNKGAKDGYTAKGEGEITDSSETAGDFRAVLENEKHNGETFQSVEATGTDPACAVGSEGSKAQRKDPLIDLIYQLLAQFSKRHGGSARAGDSALEERFSGLLEADSSEFNKEVRIAVQADLIR